MMRARGGGMASGMRKWPEMASRSHRGDPGFGIVGLVQQVTNSMRRETILPFRVVAHRAVKCLPRALLACVR
jgi:hypothetical protein